MVGIHKAAVRIGLDKAAARKVLAVRGASAAYKGPVGALHNNCPDLLGRKAAGLADNRRPGRAGFGTFGSAFGLDKAGLDSRFPAVRNSFSSY